MVLFLAATACRLPSPLCIFQTELSGFQSDSLQQSPSLSAPQSTFGRFIPSGSFNFSSSHSFVIAAWKKPVANPDSQRFGPLPIKHWWFMKEFFCKDVVFLCKGLKCVRHLKLKQTREGKKDTILQENLHKRLVWKQRMNHDDNALEKGRGFENARIITPIHQLLLKDAQTLGFFPSQHVLRGKLDS